jgi:D-beta-D-heptose 7-phosphate kinase / D-beta-D-heptose 1-phosphate adenosyltransferase
MRPLVVVGDTLLDRDLDGQVERLCPDAPVPVVDRPVATARPGGAGLAAALAAADRRPVTLVTALARDEAAAELRALLDAAGVTVIGLTLDGETAQKVRIRTGGRCIVRIDYGGTAEVVGPLPAAAATCLEHAEAVLVSDYGRGVTAVPTVRAVLAEAARRRPLVWDPHPRGSPPVAGARLVTPNQAEAGLGRVSAQRPLGDLHALTARARELLRAWSAAGVSITLGARGALLVTCDGTPLAVPAPPSTTAGPVDPCGAGDCYASRAAAALADGALLSDAVVAAVAAASSFVFGGGASAFTVAPPEAEEELPGADVVIARCRARGGTVVATGGCFDLLHAGHVRMLEQARRLGDCLVVCLNSDASVRRLKGTGRPVMTQNDRAAVLLGLGCVDAVVVFDEDTPEAVLDRLRPDIWAKGGDYTVADLPEAPLVGSWGGQAVVLPYLDGRSTTNLIQEAIRHGP